MQTHRPTLLRLIAAIAGLSTAAAPVVQPDLGIAACDIVYDSADGRLLLYISATRPEQLLPARITVRDGDGAVPTASALIREAADGRGRCVVPWPRRPPNARIQVSVVANSEHAEADRTNNAATVSMSTALKNMGRLVQRLLTERGMGSIVCLEAEELPVQDSVSVESVAGASGGRAVRFTHSASRLETEVDLAPGAYLLYAIGMGASPDQDAISVTLGKTAMRLFFAEKEWSRMDAPNPITSLDGGAQRLVIRFAEPNVLVDKVCLIPLGLPD